MRRGRGVRRIAFSPLTAIRLGTRGMEKGPDMGMSGPFPVFGRGMARPPLHFP